MESSASYDIWFTENVKGQPGPTFSQKLIYDHLRSVVIDNRLTGFKAIKIVRRQFDITEKASEQNLFN